MAFLAMGPACVAAIPGPLQQNGWLIYQDSHVRQAIPCGQPILLRGNHTDLTLSGGCGYVRVAGAHNGVTWHQIAPGQPPWLLDRGHSNTFHNWTPAR